MLSQVISWLVADSRFFFSLENIDRKYLDSDSVKIDLEKNSYIINIDGIFKFIPGVSIKAGS